MEIENNLSLVVSTLEDENDGDFSKGDLSLREAIANAEAGATITFDSSLSGGTINVSADGFIIDKDLTITGLGANNLTIDGSKAISLTDRDLTYARVFEINDGNDDAQSNVTIEGITVSGNFQGSSGIANRENLTLNTTNISNNLTADPGGGINNSGNLVLNNSLVSGNSTTVFPFIQGGGIFNSGTASIINSAVIGNRSSNAGGGISNVGSLTIENSIIINNGSSNAGGGTDIFTSDASTATITSSITGRSSTGSLVGDFTSGGNNLIAQGEGRDSVTGFTNGENGDLVGSFDEPLDLQINYIQNNSGAIESEGLRENSLAIDVGNNPNNLATDLYGDELNRTMESATDL